MTFVDTGAWFASVMPKDPDHRAVADWLAANEDQLITTDYVVDETLTLLLARGQQRRAWAMGERLFAGDLALLHYLTEEEIGRAWRVFCDYEDKLWSFTDCTSKVTMETFGLVQALALDSNFRQFGSVKVVPLSC